MVYISKKEECFIHLQVIESKTSHPSIFKFISNEYDVTLQMLCVGVQDTV